MRMLRVVALIASAALFAGCSGAPDEVQLHMPELSAVADGVYRGTASVPPVIARVKVSIENGRITDFTILRHLTGQGQAAEALADRIVERQSIELDAVSGATISSKAILKAGEKALHRGLER